MGWLGWARSKPWVRNPARFVKRRLFGLVRRFWRDAKPIDLEQLAQLPRRLRIGRWELAFNARWPIRAKLRRLSFAEAATLPSHLTPIWSRQSQRLKIQRVEDRAQAEALPYRPLISIVVPVANSPSHLLARTVLSVRRQSYSLWELCLIDNGSPPAMKYVWESVKHDSRIRVLHRREAGGDSTATNDGIRLAQGDFLAFLEPDDELADDALFQIVKRLNEVPNADLLYSDHDTIDEFGNRSNPFWKPDWSPDYLRAKMYLGDLMVIRRELLVRAGGCDSRFDGIQKFELVLRLSEQTRRIEHLAMLLYHRRVPAESPDVCSRIPELQAHAVQEHLNRLQLPMIAEPHESHGVTLHPKPRRVYPRVSVLIPESGSADSLKQSLHALTAQTTYPNLEIFTRGPAPRGWSRHPVHEIQFGEPISRCEAINRMARLAESRFLLLLAAGTKPLTPDWIERLLMYADRSEIGAVGPMSADGEYLDRSRQIGFVSSDCLFIARSHFKTIDGFNEHLESREGDMDLCRRLADRGLQSLRVVGAKIVLPSQQ
jgi:GT2 family glycosyltransferase